MPEKSLSPTTKPKVNPEVYQLFNQRKGRDGTKRGWDTVNWYKNLPNDYKARVHQQSGYSKDAIAKWNKTIYNRKFDKKKPTWRYRPIAEDDLMSGITNEFGKGRTMMHTISPDKFISLASPAGSLLNKEHVAKIKKRILEGKSYSTPRLWMDPYESKTMKPNQKEWFSVRSHEGRHRAHAAKELGIKEMPVFVGTQETGRRDYPLSKTELSRLRKFNVESQDDADNRLYGDRNNGKSRPKPRGLGAVGEEEEEAGAKIAAIIATLYPQMNKAQQAKAKILISRITKRPDKQVLRDIAKFLARFGASNPAISKKIEALFKNINKQPIAVAVEQSPKTPEKAQEKADEKLDGFVTKMMAFLTASGLIISAQESRKIRLKEARSNKKGIPKSGDKEIPTTPDGIPRKKSQREILAILTTKHDPRVDDVCIPFHGLPFKLGDPLRPKLPLHYGCRCTWIDKETGEDLGQL